MTELINVEHPVNIEDSDLDLLETPTTKSINLELTSRCNLRCVYCALSHPDYVGQDLTDIGNFDCFVNDLKARKIHNVCISGSGETLIFKHWRSYCQKLLDAGFAISMISNFAREMDQEDYDTLARLSQIDVSCDTADLKLFRKLRRGGDFRMLLYNMARVRAAAYQNGHQAPSFGWSCVVTDQSVLGLEHYVSMGVSMGVRQFNFCNFAKLEDLSGSNTINHICEMPHEQFYEALGVLERALKLIKAFGLEVVFQDGLLDSIHARVNEDHARTEQRTSQMKDEKLPPYKQVLSTGDAAYAVIPKNGQTRDCMDPWTFAIVRADGEVTPCCFHSPIGSLSSGKSINDVLNNSSMKRIRQNLLSGDLDTSCRTCPGRQLTDCETLQDKVRGHLAETV